jgi:hypothetical protein
VMKPKDWSDFEKQLLAKLARKGISPRAISIEIGRHIGAVKRVARGDAACAEETEKGRQLKRPQSRVNL